MPTTFMLFGLGFSNLPLLQMGIAAVSLPIIIHLLNKRKYRERPWAAMRFLLAAVKKNQRRIRIEQWLLLAVRTLLILCLILAMAKPFLESLGALALLPGDRTHRVIVLDGSMSMAYTPAELNRFDRAKALASQLVRDARRGDAISLVLMADPPRVIVGEAAPSSNQAELLKEIAQVVMPHGTTDLTASLEAVDRVLGVSTISRKEVVFVTDLQAATWRKLGTGTADTGLERAVKKLAERKARSVVIDLGGAGGGENIGVVDFRLNQPVVTVGATDLVATAVIHNHGSTEAKAVRVRLLIDGQLGPEQSIDIAAGADQTVNLRPILQTAGEHLLEIRLPEDPQPLDNRRLLSVPVRDVLQVLLVDGDLATEAFASETDYLSQALNPSGSPGSPSLIKTRVMPESRFARQDLAGFDVVMLCNVAQFSETEVGGLEAFLKQGGGVVFFGGDQVLSENHNRLLHADGSGLLPARIGEPRGDAADKAGAFEFNPLGFQHPIIRPFFGAEAAVIAGLTNSKTWKYHQLILPEGTEAKVALAFDSGDPAIVEIPRHRGRVIQVATSADSEWTTWPLHPSYAPVMEQIVLQAAAGKTLDRNTRVGRPLDHVLPASAANILAELVRPDGGKVDVKIKPDGDVSRFHYEATELSGPYKLRLTPGDEAGESIFTTAIDPIESDLVKLDRTTLASAIPGWTFSYLTNWEDLTDNAVAVAHRGEMHRSLLLAVLALLLIESLLAWRFGHHAS